MTVRTSRGYRVGLVGWLGAFAVTLAAVGVWRWEARSAPPYWDAVFGIWFEAHFLEETDFDYRRLRYEEKHGTRGGAYSYMTSIVPTALAVAFRLVPDSRVVITGYHWFNFACAAATIATVWLVLRSRAGPVGATLVALALVTTPVFSAQVDMASMELPLTLSALGAGLLAAGRRWRGAAIACLVTFAIKTTGLLVAVAAAGLAVLDLATARRGSRQWRRALAGLAALTLVIGVALLVVRWGGTLPFHLDPKNRPDIAGLVAALVWFPDLVVYFGLVFAAWAILAAASFARVAQRSRPGNIRRTVRLWLRLEPQVLFGVLFVPLVILSTTRLVLIPRYVIVTLPFVALMAGRLLYRPKPSRVGGHLILALVIGANLLNQDGSYYPSIAGAFGRPYARTGAMLERSREYFADHAANTAALERLAQIGDEPILAGHPFVYALSVPRLGYVSRPLHGFTLNEFSDSWPFFADIATTPIDSLPAEPVIVKVDNSYYHQSIRLAIPDPEPGDEILFADGLEPPLVVFRKRWGGRVPERAGLRRWYLERLLPWASPEERALALATQVEAWGDVEGQIAALRTGLDGYPASPRSAWEAARRHRAAGRVGEALAAALEAPTERSPAAQPESVDAKAPAGLNAALEHALSGQSELAARELEKIAAPESGASDADRATALSGLGARELTLGAVERAARRLEAARKLVDAPVVQRYLGLARLAQGRPGEAQSLFEKYLESRPADAEIWHALGLAQIRQGDRAAARVSWSKAVERSPGFRTARRDRERLEREWDDRGAKDG